MREDMNRLMDDVACPSPFVQSSKRVAQFRPVADVVECEHAFHILVELPGLEREDVALEVRGDELVVFGERRLPRDAPDSTFQLMERSYGCFARRFSFPMNLEGLAIQASMRAGLLSVLVPKRQGKSGHRHIAVEVGA